MSATLIILLIEILIIYYFKLFNTFTDEKFDKYVSITVGSSAIVCFFSWIFITEDYLYIIEYFFSYNIANKYHAFWDWLGILFLIFYGIIFYVIYKTTDKMESQYLRQY